MSPVVTSRPRVRDLLAGRSRFERGSADLAAGPRVALLAHWSHVPRVTRSVATLVRELQDFGYRVVVTSSCEAPDALAWPAEVDIDALTVIRKPNVGYDFGSWSIALEMVPDAARADRTIIANDSMAGPFTTLRPMLESLDRTPVDVWAMTDAQQFARHLQSYFLAFCGGVLAERQLQRFWADVRHEPDKTQIIQRGELGLGHLLRHEGFIHRPEFSHELVVAAGLNPVIKGWKRLLDLGFPFLKREILRSPEVAPAGRSAPLVIQRRFGEDVGTWVDDVVAA